MSRELLLSIARCPQAATSLTMTAHPCGPLVASQRSRGIATQQLPEPWNGDLEAAPLLFIASNPALSRTEVYPDAGWDDERIVRFFGGRFGDAADSPISAGAKVLNADGSRGRANPFLSSVRKRAAELGLARPGTDYAVTEVVHCKSANEAAGVAQALGTCTKQSFAPLLAASGACVFVFLGAVAASVAKEMLALDPAVRLHGPLPLAGRTRMAVFLPHPNARGVPKSLRGNLGPGVERLRGFLAEHGHAVHA